MNPTPLQRYKEAYTLQYVEHDTTLARKMYQQLVKEFPGSDIAEYATIQLEEMSKVIDGDIAPKTPITKSGVPIVMMIALIINFLLSVFLFVMLSVNGQAHKRNSKELKEYVQEYSRVFSKLYTNSEGEAFNILGEIKRSNENDISPYEVTADMYLKRHKFQKARREYKQFIRRNPNQSIPDGRFAYIDKAEELYKNKTMPKQDTVETFSEPQGVVPERKKSVVKQEEKTTPMIKPKGKLADTISYF